MSSAHPRQGERMILQEDCAEDKLKNGILSLTNQRIIFEKTEGQMATLTKKRGEILIDVPLKEIKSTRKEGRIIKKIVIEMDNNIYKFGVFDTRKWEKTVLEQLKNTSG